MKRNEKGFTLIEMMVVMLVISVLLVITIPNVTKHNENINKKGCGAYKKMVEAQVQAYEMDLGKYPTSITELVQAEYLPKNAGGCPGGNTKIVIGPGGTVTEEAISGP
ncbi:prepilin-type N-terminal cleavage/methylation domain-containing protein [Neobacillus notoginsengisoli]|uniref:ComG operon protein 3 n=2 Tax=Neobacillus notoginsengisoli TaxID=1578198 RepID=A0A417YVH4_9BACI|nr:prepilin-type N-terminal cleavage/methylation domain-containing protein [Neobacillus notoginsengisoli]